MITFTSCIVKIGGGGEITRRVNESGKKCHIIYDPHSFSSSIIFPYMYLRYMKTQTKNETFVKYWSFYLHNTDCKAVPLNATENPLF